MSIALITFLWIVLSVVSVIVAGERDTVKSPYFFFLVSLILSPVVGVAVALLAARKPVVEPPPFVDDGVERVMCNSCGEDVPVADVVDKVCPSCAGNIDG